MSDNNTLSNTQLLSSNLTVNIPVNGNGLTLGANNSSPVFTDSQTTGIINSGLVADMPFVTVNSDGTISFNGASSITYGNTWFYLPSCTVTLTTAEPYAVIYLTKTSSESLPTSNSISVTYFPSGSSLTPSEMITHVISSLTTPVCPLLVVTAAGTLTNGINPITSITYNLSDNGNYVMPLVNALDAVQQWETNCKNYVLTQMTAIKSLMENYSSWLNTLREGQIYVSFTPSSNIKNFNNTSGIQGSTVDCLTINPLCKVLNFNLHSCVSQTYAQTKVLWWSQVHNTNSGLDLWYAPSQDVVISQALSTTTDDTNGYWEKNLIWSSTDGNLYSSIGDSGEVYILKDPSMMLPEGVSIIHYNGSTVYDTEPADPFSSPNISVDWQ